MVRITGKELKDSIPENLTVEINSVSLIPGSELVILDAESSEGPITIPIYRKKVARLLGKNTRKRKPNGAEPTSAQPTTTEEDVEESAEEAPCEPPRGLYVGKERRKDGKTQRLAGFTDSGSIMHKPPRTTRRVRHPETGLKVWPIWENIGD
jgi:hypothetical protein